MGSEYNLCITCVSCQKKEEAVDQCKCGIFLCYEIVAFLRPLNVMLKHSLQICLSVFSWKEEELTTHIQNPAGIDIQQDEVIFKGISYRRKSECYAGLCGYERRSLSSRAQMILAFQSCIAGSKTRSSNCKTEGNSSPSSLLDSVHFTSVAWTSHCQGSGKWNVCKENLHRGQNRLLILKWASQGGD